MQVNDDSWPHQRNANVSEFTYRREEESFTESFPCMVKLSGLTFLLSAVQQLQSVRHSSLNLGTEAGEQGKVERDNEAQRP